MFGIGFSELLVIALALIILVRPSDLPTILRKLGRAYGSLKKTLSELTDIKDEFLKEVEKAAEDPEPAGEEAEPRESAVGAGEVNHGHGRANVEEDAAIPRAPH